MTWGRRLLEDALPVAEIYVEESKISVEQNLEAFSYFYEKWKAYLKERGIFEADVTTEAVFPGNYWHAVPYFRSVNRNRKYRSHGT